jgi:neutral ceramidase
VTRAGVAKVELSPAAGRAELVGYVNRDGPACGVHDPLFVRALVLETPAAGPVAVCSVELCYVGEDVVAASRARIARDAGIPADRVFVSATHTHSGPHDVDPRCWPEGLDGVIAAAVGRACAGLRPACVGAGWGMVHGVAMNRRRFEDPVDPAALVVRVDDDGGRPLGLYCGFGCHAVVLGPDNRLVSGDWPGSCSRVLEARLGGVALIGQGACGDVNPLTADVHGRLREGGAVAATAADTWYYGAAGGTRRIGDRTGGGFEEAERLGRVIAEEALRVHDGIQTQEITGIRTRRIAVPAGATEHAAVGPGHQARDGGLLPRAGAAEPLEIMTVALDGPGVLLVGQPGEVFADTGARLRRSLRRAGARAPFVVGYANGWRGYLPPADAFPDGGYEVDWARLIGLSETLQADIAAAVLDGVGLGESCAA